MRVDELAYDLPRELIATEPPAQRDGARLLLLSRKAQSIEHSQVRSLPSLLPRDTVMVVNDTKVIKARLHGKKPTGGAVEIFLLRPLNAEARRWTAFGRASKALQPGTRIALLHGHVLTVTDKDPADGVLTVEFAPDVSPWAVIDACGEIPLPPYMDRAPTEQDQDRYQCVFAKHPGAVAAPTAGLHLSEQILDEMQRIDGFTQLSVTLHVGAGTFQPVSVDNLDDHPMHSEHYEISAATAAVLQDAKARGRPVFAVGTTVVRALESWALGVGALSGETRLLLQPGSPFCVVDWLLTNFHLPRSTLLALVMAFADKSLIKRAYETAVAERYRFFSYGDAMLIRP
jgi:S-adenosylmethionine:tRNA ribosyltransferase-isomerase